MLRNPVRGKVKTRIAQEAGDDKALDIYLHLLERTKNITAGLHADKFIFYSDVVERNDIFPDAQYKKYVQCSGDLGTRMEYAFSIPFKNEYKQVVMIGADCYDLETQHIEQAFTSLAENDFVIGPAADGGYYLIGMKKWNRWIFHEKSWSTSSLFEETKQSIQSANGKLFLLPVLSDIDTAEDAMSVPALKAML